MKEIREIRELLKKADGKTYDVCYKLLSENEHNMLEVFQYACENHLELRKNELSDDRIVIENYFTEEEIATYIFIHGATVRGILGSAVKNCAYGIVDEKDFYKTLWQGVSALLITLKDKAFAFYYILNDRRIPYQHIGIPLYMDKETYAKKIEESKSIFNKINYIFEIGFRFKNEISSLVLRCIDEIENEELRVVALAHAFSLHTKEMSPSKDINDALLRRIDARLEDNLEDKVFDALKDILDEIEKEESDSGVKE